ncbi:hypothetical protein [Deinococcus sp. ME38]|uniref:ORC-CDC6 family AAA ATPase n=1 Tax=Deinococcus sp. ME38 TaxID=3400344 RepID=UPI003B5C85A3
MTAKEAIESIITASFSSYRHEWLRDVHLYYTEPRYFHEISTPRPCFLIGGRGTGKTTALKSMSYEFILESNGYVHTEVEYYGVYHKFEQNITNSFRGKGISEEKWFDMFSHYINIQICTMIFKLLSGLEKDLQHKIITQEELAIIAAAFFEEIDSNDDLSSMYLLLRRKMSELSKAVNNPRYAEEIDLTTLGYPIKELFEVLANTEKFRRKYFYIIFDEFENLQIWQQKILNTLIKHCGNNFVYKIGTKSYGIKTKDTLSENEPLIAPQDFAKIDIDERTTIEDFAEFAFAVCNKRLQKIQENSDTMRCPQINVKLLLPRLEPEAEAELLGVRERIDSVDLALSKLMTISNFEKISELSNLKKFYLLYRSERDRSSLDNEIQLMLKGDKAWNTNYENYKYDLLFKIKKGKRGVLKYYTGWETYLYLSGKNIRFILMLLEKTLLLSVRDKPCIPKFIDHMIQTKSCQFVSQSLFDEIIGLSSDGLKFQRLTMGFGKLFNYFAISILNRSPEINQINITDISQNEDVESFVKDCVMHYVLIEYRESKQISNSEVEFYDYSLHPMFAPKFEYSYRRKRKININSELFRLMSHDPDDAVKIILGKEIEKINQPKLLEGL